ncbi:MAG: ABC transporter substrate-binding protein [Peptococcaceae bacterium]|jgi:ABC-type Fe3+ transport system substrate-binding protein|nr:ABC transporter substrate-binding protein [Peptococcaceae bacterium]
MVKIQIRLPLNISRGLEEILREHVITAGDDYQTEFAIENSHSSGAEADIFIGFMPELAVQTDRYLQEHMLKVPGRFPISKELQDSGFVEPGGYFHTFGIVPFVMFYNPAYTDESEIPRAWHELLAPKWKGRVMMPGKEHIAPKVIRAVLKYGNPEQAPAVDENITYRGTPPNVIEAVKNGEFALGIANITFGRISESQKIKMFWPEEGLLCMPQIIAWKKGLAGSLLKLGDFMLSPRVQDFLMRQTFVPAAPEADPPALLKDNYAVLKWIGWGNFRAAMRRSAS